MARRKISEHFAIDFGNNNPAWREMRNSPGPWTSTCTGWGRNRARCNADLRAAQAKRGQPVEDGYDYHITHGSRSRLNIFPDTPRAMAHEAVNQSILKNVRSGVKGENRGPGPRDPAGVGAPLQRSPAPRRIRRAGQRNPQPGPAMTTIPILGTPSAYRLTRNYFLAECPNRGWPTNITQKVPDPLPTGRRFWTLERLNTVKPSVHQFPTAAVALLRPRR
jgi:hypothetical protein